MDSTEQQVERNAQLKLCKHCARKVADPSTGKRRLCLTCNKRVQERTRYTFNPERN